MGRVLMHHLRAPKMPTKTVTRARRRKRSKGALLLSKHYSWLIFNLTQVILDFVSRVRSEKQVKTDWCCIVFDGIGGCNGICIFVWFLVEPFDTNSSCVHALFGL